MPDKKRFETFKGLNIDKEEIYKSLIKYEEEIKRIEKLENLQKKLQDIDKEIEKEKKQKLWAQGIGMVAGGSGVAALSHTGGPAAMVGGAVIGTRLGKALGPLIEEAWDKIDSGRTDLSLDVEKYKVKKEIERISHE